MPNEKTKETIVVITKEGPHQLNENSVDNHMENPTHSIENHDKSTDMEQNSHS